MNLFIEKFVKGSTPNSWWYKCGLFIIILLAAWWQQHGISCLELQRIAIRILSQTCSSVGCEHTWSTYDQVHSRRRNCLSRKRWNDLTYVHYNLRLRECQLGRKSDDAISFDNAMLESILDDWLVESERQTIQEDEVYYMIACYIFFFYGGLATNYPVCIFAWVLLGMIAMLSGISCFFPLL